MRLVVLREALAELEAQHRALAVAEEAVLWFERDLFDQLQFLQVLVQLGEKPGELVDLGEPTERPADLAALVRMPVRREQRALAARAWSAFRSPDPRELAELAGEGTDALPFLAAALQRLLEELPAVEDGLARSERELLEAVRGEGWLGGVHLEGNSPAWRWDAAAGRPVAARG